MPIDSRVYIIPAEEPELRYVLAKENTRAVAWMYLGDCVRSFERCNKWFGNRGIRLDLASELQEVARRHKQSYVEYIGELSVRFATPHWWIGSVAEKNPYISKLFLRVCHILTAVGLLKAAPEEMAVVIVADDLPVRQVLSRHLTMEGYAVTVSPQVLGESQSLFLLLLSGLVRRLLFIVHHCTKLILARLMGARQPAVWRSQSGGSDRGVVLLHGWVDERSFDENGRFRNINLGATSQYLESKGWTCCLVPLVIPDVPYGRAVKGLLASGTRFLLPHAWLTLSDVCRAAMADFLRYRWDGDVPPFCKLDMKPLIEADLRQDWLVARVPTNLLLVSLVERWAESHLPLVGFVYSYENHVWERAFCLGFRRAFPKACLIGYQDANVPDLCLNFFIARSEFERDPFPDVVISNGNYSFDVLRKAGYPMHRLHRGGALRFGASADIVYRTGSDEAEKDAEKVPRVVLVVTACGQELAAELVWKTVQALGTEEDMRVVIKCHPAFPFSRIARALGNSRLPKHFEVADRAFLELLKESGVLLYMDSTTSVEALAHGVAAVHVGSDWSLDLDTIGFPCQERIQARTPAEIAAAVRESLNLEPSRLAERRRRGRELVKAFFGPVGESAYAPVAEALATAAKPSVSLHHRLDCSPARLETPLA